MSHWAPGLSGARTYPTSDRFKLSGLTGHPVFQALGPWRKSHWWDFCMSHWAPGLSGARTVIEKDVYFLFVLSLVPRSFRRSEVSKGCFSVSTLVSPGTRSFGRSDTGQLRDVAKFGVSLGTRSFRRSDLGGNPHVGIFSSLTGHPVFQALGR